MSHYHYQSDEWCVDCLPAEAPHADVDLDSGEQDTPANCCACGKPLDYTLTAEGVQYVVEAILDNLENGIDEHIIPAAGTAEYELTYYHGSPHFAVVEAWAENLRDYALSRKDRYLVNEFLERCGDWREAHSSTANT